jgi:hypothetical protein
MSWKLTTRHGSEVNRKQFARLDEALAELERRAEAIRAEGPLEDLQMLREYKSGQRVHARLELTGPGLVRRADAGLDVMGDGALVPYRGAIFKKRLEVADSQSAYEAVREALLE